MMERNGDTKGIDKGEKIEGTYLEFYGEEKGKRIYIWFFYVFLRKMRNKKSKR